MVKTILKARTKHNKISLSTVNQVVPLHVNSDQQKILLYPNYRISEGQICFDQYRPFNDKQTFGNQTFIFKSEEDILKQIYDGPDGINIEKINNVIKAVCQIFIVTLHEKQSVSEILPQPKSSKELPYSLNMTPFTGFLVKDGSQYSIYTALHGAVCDEDFSHGQIFISFDENDYAKRFSLFVDNVILENENGKYNDLDEMICDLYTRVIRSKVGFIPADIDFNFLKHRKDWLSNLKLSKCEDDPTKYPGKDDRIVLDPIYSLRSTPSIDFMILNVESSLLSVDQRAKFLDKEEYLYSLPESENLTKYHNLELMGIIGYNGNDLKIEFKRKGTEQIEGSTVYDATLVIQKPDDVSIKADRFLYGGKSLSFGKFFGYNNQFVCFEASTIEGSSGGPIITRDGKIVGLSICSLEDFTKFEKSTEKSDLLRFDVEAQESVMSYKVSKNQNIGINIAHPCLQSYFKNPQKVQFLPEELPFVNLKTVFELHHPNQKPSKKDGGSQDNFENPKRSLFTIRGTLHEKREPEVEKRHKRSNSQ